ncbi:MAG: LOG family protein [Candidatus Aminicenantes bacterium]|nr:LOG family protein [Candidatus Aminicenantes bacterium]
MEAANRGAARAGGLTIGLNISLPYEQAPNPYISSELNMVFHYFFMRKFFLLNRARAVLAFPGGFGTLDELFEVLTLVQTDKIDRNRVYILLYGKEYWDSLIDFKELIRRGTISPEDLELFRFVSSPDEAFSFLKSHLPRFLSREKNRPKFPSNP